MLASRSSQSICLQCRLRLLAASKRLQHPRNFTTGRIETPLSVQCQRRVPQKPRNHNTTRRAISYTAILRNEASTAAQESASDESIPPTTSELEAVARAARNRFGDTLPENHLTSEELIVYERLYGPPTRITEEEQELMALEVNDAVVEEDNKNVLLKEGESGMLEEVEYILPKDQDIVDEDAELDEEEEEVGEVDEVQGQEDEIDDLYKQIDEARSQMDSAALRELEDTEEDSLGPEVALSFSDNISVEDREPSTKEETMDKILDEWPGDEYIRTHPLTASGRFRTTPSTLHIPKQSFIRPVEEMLAPLANKHLIETSHRVFGGLGIPYSPSTPRIGMSMPQKPIPLEAGQSRMAEREADVYMAGVMPQTYASIVSVLVELRKRLGAQWLRDLLKKENGPLVLDAGAGGVGVVAWREILRAEWDAMHESSRDTFDEAGSIEENTVPPVPYGKATVLTGSDALRHRASRFLENTSFIPRLPDFVDPTEVADSNNPQPRKQYDIILAPHTLWSIQEDFQRKAAVQTLWSLLNPNGGVLILLEKGVPRGFEVIAGARELLLKKHIASPQEEKYETPLEEQKDGKKERFTQKETGCIVAPCTNHSGCPLYKAPGVSRGRKDWCYFQQRYTRPSFLMTLLGAKSRNHDDVDFSYLAVQRGRDQRSAEHDSLLGRGFVQGEPATERAADGYGPRWSAIGNTPEASTSSDDTNSSSTNTTEPKEESTTTSNPTSISAEHLDPHPLSLPRTLLTPLKCKGHVLIDVCTPSGTLERWMVTKRNSKQVFRDARKARWGDLWALGARSRSVRRVNLGTPIETARVRDVDGKTGKGKGKKGGKRGIKGMGKRGMGRWKGVKEAEELKGEGLEGLV